MAKATPVYRNWGPAFCWTRGNWVRQNGGETFQFLKRELYMGTNFLQKHQLTSQ